jgi:sugar lactone lactonase YvrE
VCDIDILRGFDRHTGKLLAEVDFTPKHAIQLNDVDVGPDGRLYVTDTGIDMTDKGVIYVGGDRIYAVGPGGAIATVDSGPQLGRPNGITWDAKRQRWLVVNFEPFSSKLYAMRQGDTARTVLAHGKGKWDGVEALPDGRVVYASWSDSSVHVLSPDGTDTQLVTSAPTPADIGIDTRRMRVAIPVTNLNRLEIWTIPQGGARD